MECERKNNHREDKTVSGEKFQCEGVRVEELEDLLSSDDVDFRRILKEARDERGRNIFENFSSDDLSLLVAEWSR